jgi:hypothetical protein
VSSFDNYRYQCVGTEVFGELAGPEDLLLRFLLVLWRRAFWILFLSLASFENLSTILEYIYVEMSVLNEDRITGDRLDLRSRLDRLW